MVTLLMLQGGSYVWREPIKMHFVQLRGTGFTLRQPLCIRSSLGLILDCVLIYIERLFPGLGGYKGERALIIDKEPRCQLNKSMEGCLELLLSDLGYSSPQAEVWVVYSHYLLSFLGGGVRYAWAAARVSGN